jgi:hypothetical protein
VTSEASGARRAVGDAVEAPADEDGEWICGRACRDGTPCRRSVPLPGMACHEHEGDAPPAEVRAEESE